jgi:hypothetical protein
LKPYGLIENDALMHIDCWRKAYMAQVAAERPPEFDARKAATRCEK